MFLFFVSRLFASQDLPRRLIVFSACAMSSEFSRILRSICRLVLLCYARNIIC